VGLFRGIVALFLLLAAGVPARAASSFADAPHVRVELLAPEGNLDRGGKLNEAGLYFKLEPGWHVYWKNPGDAGEPPRIQWTLPAGISAGTLQFPAPKRLPLGPLMDFGYENEVLFPFRLRVADSVKAGPATLDAKIDWLVCQNSCIPGSAELEIHRPVLAQLPTAPVEVIPDTDIFNRLIGRFPQPLPPGSKVGFEPAGSGFRLTVETGRRETEAVFFPAEPDVLDNAAPQKFTSTAKGLVLDLKKDVNFAGNPAQLKGVVELSGGRDYTISAGPGLPAVAAEETGAEAAFSQAPTEATKVPASLFDSAAQTRFTAASGAAVVFWLVLVRIFGLAFLGGLLLNLMPCVFPVLFLKGLSLVNSGSEERSRLRAHGLVYAAGILVSFWALVGVLLGLRAAGSTLGWGFQFQSPVFLALMAGLLFFLGLSLAGQFEIGLTLTAVGGSLAQKQGLPGSFFTGVLAVVVATPCTAPFMGAAVGYALSASAAVTFAVFTALALGLAAPYVALTLEPAWTRWLPRPGAWMEVLRQAVAVPIFATVIWLAWVLASAYGAGALAALLASFLLLAIAGWFLGRWPAKRWSTAVAVLILVGVAALAVFSQRLVGEVAGGGNQAASASLDSPASDGWQPWSPEAVSRYQAEGRPVFVDFTADWCLSCQVNERVALERPEVQAAFRSAHVALLKADWTRHDEAITQALTALGRSGVPAYALYAPGESQPQMLPEVLTPGIVLDAVEKLRKTLR
jgi:thiol:disulfide interchange protein DsbD